MRSLFRIAVTLCACLCRTNSADQILSQIESDLAVMEKNADGTEFRKAAALRIVRRLNRIPGVEKRIDILCRLGTLVRDDRISAALIENALKIENPSARLAALEKAAAHMPPCVSMTHVRVQDRLSEGFAGVVDLLADPVSRAQALIAAARWTSQPSLRRHFLTEAKGEACFVSAAFVRAFLERGVSACAMPPPAVPFSRGPTLLSVRHALPEKSM